LESLADTESIPIQEALGRVLATDVVADIDLPPFEKSAMDGFAVRSADFGPEAQGSGAFRLTVLGESRAGAPFAGTVGPGECIAIYTGGELPGGADSIVIVEKSSPGEPEDPENVQRPGRTILLDDRPREGQHVCHRGEDLRAGETVLHRGRRLRSVDLAVLAAVGCQPVPVVRRPRVVLCTTGDELVTPDRKPGPGEIREGSTPMLAARLAAYGVEVENLGILPDDPVVLERAFGEALERCDVFITTGGVSMGRYDLVGGVLEGLGVTPVFHKVAIKPGKPIWFGQHGRVPVFGLPGNPVSSLVGLLVFVRPALEVLEGLLPGPDEQDESLERAVWRGGAVRAIPREQNIPAAFVRGEGAEPALEPVQWKGSADVVGLSRADAFAVVPAGTALAPGAVVAYRCLA
jgi:molybdopterin molybdotransferase